VKIRRIRRRRCLKRALNEGSVQE